MKAVPPIIFLDFDGVIMTAQPESRFRKPDSRAIDNLNRLVFVTGGFVVISSTWRGMGLGRCRAILRDGGFTGKPIGITPSLHLSPRDTYCRGDEIAAWLQRWRQERRPILILDDDYDMGPLLPRLIRTKSVIGLTGRDVLRAIELWRGDGSRGPVEAE